MSPKAIFSYLLVLSGVRRDRDAGFQLLTRLGRRLVPDYRFTWPEIDWFGDRVLAGTLERFEENDGFNAHRKFALRELLRLTSAVEGDTAECGVYKGCSSYLILQANLNSKLQRTHHVFDSFAGLSAPANDDGDYWRERDLAVAESVVERNLAGTAPVALYKGWIPSRFGEVEHLRFSFVHVDVDLFQPTSDSIAFFYDRLSPGAIFVCDDYGFSTCPGATRAIDEYLQKKQEKMVGLSGGGGFFIKGCPTEALQNVTPESGDV